MNIAKFIIALILSAGLAACGGGGSGGGNAAGGGAVGNTGTVTITLADGSVDGYSKIIMVINEIRLLSDSGQDILVLDQPATVDFLSLSNFSEVLIKREVVAGTYSKIRLILDSLTLVKTDAAGHDTFTDVSLNGLQKIDINPQGPFQVRGGEQIIINVDLDLDRSIHIVQAGNSGKVLFRPVIFATISTQPAFDHLYRVEGTIDSINGGANTFKVCDIRRVSGDGSQSPNPQDVCVFTDPNGATSYFDSESIPMGAGFGGLAVNDPVVMYGKFDPLAATDTFVPAVIALGSHDTFARERGISSLFVPDPNDADAPGTMNLDEVSAICLLNPVQRAVSVAAETAVFSEDANGDATRVNRTAIERCRATEVEGTVVTGADDFLRSFVVLQGEPVVVEEELVGKLETVSGGKPGEYKLMLSPPASGEQCVIVNDATDITEIKTDANGTTVTPLDTVPLSPAEVSVIGTRDADNCLVATQVIHEI